MKVFLSDLTFYLTCDSQLEIILDGWCDIKPAYQEKSVDESLLYKFHIYPSFYSRLLLISASPQFLTAWASQQTQMWSIFSRSIKTTILFQTAASDRVREQTWKLWLTTL